MTGLVEWRRTQDGGEERHEAREEVTAGVQEGDASGLDQHAS